MCPDPYNMLKDVIFIAVLMCTLLYLPLAAAWIAFGIACWIFAPRHSVFCGIPMWHKSRWEVWRTGSW